MASEAVVIRYLPGRLLARKKININDWTTDLIGNEGQIKVRGQYRLDRH